MSRRFVRALRSVLSAKTIRFWWREGFLPHEAGSGGETLPYPCFNGRPKK